MKLEYAKNPVWANAEQTMIDLTIKFDEINEELPFSANPNDIEAHGRTIFQECVAGQYGDIAEYVPPPVVVLPPEPTKEEQIAKLQAQIDALKA
jgi:hypothetical protein